MSLLLALAVSELMQPCFTGAIARSEILILKRTFLLISARSECEQQILR